MDILNLFIKDQSSMFQDDGFLSMILLQEKSRRIQMEGPPEANMRTITEINGSQLQVRENGSAWDINNPCTKCNDDECQKYLIELSMNTYPVYMRDGVISICNNPLNNTLLRMLCAWRKHVKDTVIIEKVYGSEKWKKYSICTSELTFLGRKTEIGGILGIISLTNKHICGLPSLVSLMEKEEGIHGGVKCLSAGFALLITMYMEWDLYTEENKIITTRLLKKIKKNGLTGLETYNGTPWYVMFKSVLERNKIPDKLKEFILSRAHLP
jgi:hypothetical protein